MKELVTTSIAIIDFFTVVNKTIIRLENGGYFLPHIDYREILEHTIDCVLLGSLYEENTGDLFKEALEYYRIPSDFFKELSREFRKDISAEFEKIADFYTDDIQFTITWNRVGYDATVEVHTTCDKATFMDMGLNKNIYET